MAAAGWPSFPIPEFYFWIEEEGKKWNPPPPAEKKEGRREEITIHFFLSSSSSSSRQPFRGFFQLPSCSSVVPSAVAWVVFVLPFLPLLKEGKPPFSSSSSSTTIFPFSPFTVFSSFLFSRNSLSTYCTTDLLFYAPTELFEKKNPLIPPPLHPFHTTAMATRKKTSKPWR